MSLEVDWSFSWSLIQSTVVVFVASVSVLRHRVISHLGDSTLLSYVVIVIDTLAMRVASTEKERIDKLNHAVFGDSG
jgi:hypothetical protein